MDLSSDGPIQKQINTPATPLLEYNYLARVYCHHYIYIYINELENNSVIVLKS